MPRRIKIKFKTCCATSTGIYFALPTSASIAKLRSQYVKRTGGMSLDLKICHVPIAVDKGLSPICENYQNGEWSAR